MSGVGGPALSEQASSRDGSGGCRDKGSRDGSGGSGNRGSPVGAARPDTRHPPPEPPRGVSWRALVLGAALLPVAIYWLIALELVRGVNFPTVLTLLPPAVCFVFVLALMNRRLERRGSRFALTPGELVTVYSLVAVGASVAGCDVLQTLCMLLVSANSPGHTAQEWDLKYTSRLPDWATVSDPRAIKGFFEGNTSLYLPQHYQPWLIPILCWMVFLASLLLALFCINAVFRRHWIQSERLSFPIVALPLALARPGGESVLGSRTFWLGFALVVALDTTSGLRYLYASVPALDLKQIADLGPSFSSPPWNAIGWTPITLYPFALGIGFLMPLDLAFSCWVFFWVWKAQRVAAAAWGNPEGPLFAQQASGAWLGILAITLWSARRYLMGTLKQALHRESPGGDEEEALPYRTAYLGAALGFGGMFAFATALGMAPWVAAAYMALYLGLCIVIARVRAETGPPVHDLHASGPDNVLATLVGPQQMDQRSLSGMTMFYWLNREGCRSQPMPHHMEGLKLSSALRTSARRLTLAMYLAALFGGLLTFWVCLHQAYHLGVAGRFRGPAVWFATEGFSRLDGWVNSPPPLTAAHSLAMGFGFVFSAGLLVLRQHLLWLPLHPIGYLISPGWAMHLMWCPIAIAWLIKALALRYGGLRGYRLLLPFFMGGIVGEFVTIAVWQFIGLAGNFSTYSFFP